MLKLGGAELVVAIRELFDDILQHRGEVTSQWKKTRLRVLVKKRDVRSLDNYTPISILPITLKLFSQVLHARIVDLLARGQCGDQTGFRQGFGCEDHLFAITMLHEKSEKLSVPIWAAAIDFRKAFDAVEQGEIWTALEEQGSHLQYVQIFKRLY